MMYARELVNEIHRKGRVYVKVKIGEHTVLVAAEKRYLIDTFRKYLSDVDIPSSRENGYLVIG
jgi:hypothetical protein